MAYSMDFRQRVIDDCDAGLGTKAVAQKYSVSPAWVCRLKRHRRERGHLKPLKTGPRGPRKIDRDQLAACVKQRPDATLAELRAALGVDCSLSAICVALRELKLTYKKRCSTPQPRSGIGGTWPNLGRDGGPSN